MMREYNLITDNDSQARSYGVETHQLSTIPLHVKRQSINNTSEIGCYSLVSCDIASKNL